MYKILLLTPDPQMLCQIPQEWKDTLDIDLSPKEGKVYDYCFCYELVPEVTDFKIVKSGACIFIPGEPKSIKGFGSKFLQQFDSMFSFREDLPSRLPGIIPANLKKPVKSCLTPWRVGLSEKAEREKTPRTIRSVDEILKRPIQKSKLISMVVSSKTGTPMQRARLKLLNELITRLPPGSIDFYGRGFNHPLIKEIDDKAEALDDYMFSIAVENSCDPGYITEKLTDCFITGTVPLYAGALNYECFYHSKGIIPIDIWNPDSIVPFIEQVILKYGSVLYNELVYHVLSNRNKVIYQNSIIAVIYKIVTGRKVSFDEVVEKRLIPDTVGYFY